MSSVQLTENGFTPEFEAKILAEASEAHAAVANGTARLYKNSAELRADLDAEDNVNTFFSNQTTWNDIEEVEPTQEEVEIFAELHAKHGY